MRFLCIYKPGTSQTEWASNDNEQAAMGKLVEDMAKAGVLLTTGGFDTSAPTVRLRIDDGLARGLGLLELGCVVGYLIPRTAVLGAILLTGFLGGAIATHVRVGDPLLSHTLFPLYIGVPLWGGLYLREPRLRALVSSRR